MNVSNQTMTRYLLGELPAEEQEAFEKAYFDDPRVFAEVSAAETTLIDDYVRGRLTPDVRRRFEQIYLTDPRRRERVAFAEVLVARADAAASPSARGRAWSSQLAIAAAVVIAIAAGVLWFIAQRSTLRQAPTQAGATAPDAPLGPTAPAEPVVPVPTLALVLAPGVRSAEARAPVTLIIPAGAEEARLALTIQDAESQRFRVILRAIGGPEILRRDLPPRTSATAQTFTITLAASRFDSGDYMLTLQGATSGSELEDLSQSLFRVRRQR
jgi:anti-sigma factor RsiW